MQILTINRLPKIQEVNYFKNIYPYYLGNSKLFMNTQQKNQQFKAIYMDFLIISNNTLFLQGITLRTNFILQNPNPQLAITFKIKSNTFYDDSSKQDLQALTIFPNQGIIFPKQAKIIMVKAAKELQTFLFENSSFDNVLDLKIQQTFMNQFNRINTKNDTLNKQKYPLSHSKQQTIFVHVGIDHVGILDDISSEAAISHKFGKQTNELSIITSSGEQKNFVEGKDELNSIVQELSIQSKIQQKINERESVSEQKIGEFSKDVASFQTINQSINMHSIQDGGSMEKSLLEFFEKTKNGNREGENHGNRNFTEILILTIISALFFCLGSNLKTLINI